MSQPITNLALGSRVKLGRYNPGNTGAADIIWYIVKKETYTDSDGNERVSSITLFSQDVLDILAFDAREITNTNTSISQYGNNKYSQSNIRQWLNSSAITGWFSNQNTTDAEPNSTNIILGKPYSTKGGFLSEFTPEELNIILTTNVKTFRNNIVYNGVATYDITHDKIFLPSLYEIFGNLYESDYILPNEGKSMPYLAEQVAVRKSYPSTALVNSLSSSPIGNVSLSTTTQRAFSTRTPDVNNASIYMGVAGTGLTIFDNGQAASGTFGGVRPMCNISPYVEVSDSASDGIYSIEKYSSRLMDLSVGSIVKYGKYRLTDNTPLDITWYIGDKNHEGYPDNSVTLVSQYVIDFRAFDAGENNSPISGRNNYGNNRYTLSNIRQWLNSDDIANGWYVKSHIYDNPPNNTTVSGGTGYESRPGFLYNFTEREKRALLNTKLTTGKNTISDNGGSEECVDKIFLLSRSEVGLGTENAIIEGTTLKLFDINPNNRICYTTQNTINDLANVPDHPNKPTSVAQAVSWRLRTAMASSTYSAVVVGVTGERANNMNANDGIHGIRVACNLPGDSIVTYLNSSTNKIYTIETNIPASIYVHGLGNNVKSSPFSFSFHIEDYVTNNVTVYIDNTPMRGYVSMNVSPNVKTVVDIDDIFNYLQDGSHTIKIVADNGIRSEFEVSFDKVTPSNTRLFDTISGPLYKKTETGYVMVLPVTTADNVYYDIENNLTIQEKLLISNLGIHPIISTGSRRTGNVTSIAMIREYNIVIVGSVVYKNGTSYRFDIYDTISGKQIGQIENLQNNSSRIWWSYTNDGTDNIIINLYSSTISGSIRYLEHYTLSNIDNVWNFNTSEVSEGVARQVIYYSPFDDVYCRLNITGVNDNTIDLFSSEGEKSIKLHNVPISYAPNGTGAAFLNNAEFTIDTFNDIVFIKYGKYLDKYILNLQGEYTRDVNSTYIFDTYEDGLAIRLCNDDENGMLYVHTSGTNASTSLPEYKLFMFQESTMDLLMEKTIGFEIVSLVRIKYDNHTFLCTSTSNDKIIIFDENLNIVTSIDHEHDPDNSYAMRLVVDTNNMNTFFVGGKNGEVIKYGLMKNGCGTIISRINDYTITRESFEQYTSGAFSGYRSTIYSEIINKDSTVDINASGIETYQRIVNSGLYPVVEEDDGCAYIYSSDIPDDFSVDIKIYN